MTIKANKRGNGVMVAAATGITAVTFESYTIRSHFVTPKGAIMTQHLIFF